MSEDTTIPVRTVAEWKSRGFTFAPTTDAVGCTRVTLDGKPFYYFLLRRVATATQLMATLQQELNHAGDNSLIVAGEFADADDFPYFLVTEESQSLLDENRRQRDDLLELANDKVSFFAEALLTPETYWG